MQSVLSFLMIWSSTLAHLVAASGLIHKITAFGSSPVRSQYPPRPDLEELSEGCRDIWAGLIW